MAIAHELLGHALAAQGLWVESEVSLRRAQALAPNFPSVQLALERLND